MFTPIDTPDRLAAVCRRRDKLSDKVFCAAVIEALNAGVPAKRVLIEAGIDPTSLPRYASLVAAGFFTAAADPSDLWMVQW